MSEYTSEQINEIEHAHISDILQGIVLNDRRSRNGENIESSSRRLSSIWETDDLMTRKLFF
jgi:hypothetical protein